MKEFHFKEMAVTDPRRLKFTKPESDIYLNTTLYMLPGLNEITVTVDEGDLNVGKYVVYDVIKTSNNKVVPNARKIRSNHYSTRPVSTVSRLVTVIYNFKPLSTLRYPNNVLGIQRTDELLASVVDKIITSSQTGTRSQLIEIEAPYINRTAIDYARLMKLNARSLQNDIINGLDYTFFTLQQFLVDKACIWERIPTDLDVYFVFSNQGKITFLSMKQLVAIKQGGGKRVEQVNLPKYSETQIADFLPKLLRSINKSRKESASRISGDIETPEGTTNEPDPLKEYDVVIENERIVDKQKAPEFKTTTPGEQYEDYLDDLSDELSPKQYRAARKFIKQETPNIYSSGTVDEFTTLTEADKTIVKKDFDTNSSNMDKSTQSSMTETINSQYINKLMDKHIVGVFDSFKRGGVSVVSHKIENKTNITGSYDVHTIQVKSVRGGTTTIPIRLPKINDDGTYVFNNSQYRMRQQKVDLPILKISHKEVTLTSYYGPKQFIARSELMVDNPFAWITKQLSKRALIVENKTLIEEGDVYDKTDKVPYTYAGLSRSIVKYKDPRLSLQFDSGKAEQLGPVKPNVICIGKHSAYGLLYMDFDNLITGNKFSGSIYELLDLPNGKAPKDTAYVSISGSRIYLGMYLSYLLGIIPLLKLLKCDVEVVKARARVTGAYIIKFRDVKLVVNNVSATAALIVSGLLKYRLRDFDFKAYNNKDTFKAILLHEAGISSRVTNEYRLVRDMFIDPITEDVLKDMKEPTDYILLVIRACEMLTRSEHPRSTELQRIRGYERMAGAIYSEMIKSMRAHRNRPGTRIEMSPYAVWSKVTGDSSNKIVEASNPIAALRDGESVIASGDGGRSSETLTIDARKYDENDIGVISESIPDNGDVGLVMYLSANPDIKNLNGFMNKTDKLDTKNLGQYYSSSIATVPCTHKDDFSRMAFVAIQGQHVIATNGMETTYVRTGYENIIPQRMTKNYAVMAPQDGDVVSKTPEGIIVKYKDGTKQGVKLGTEYTIAEGARYDHQLITNLNKGDKFKKGWALSWHSGYFEPDTWSKGGLLYRYSKMAMFYLSESTLNYEDSVVMGTEVADDMVSSMVVEKSYTADFTDNLINLMKIGSEVDVGTPLFTLTNEQVAASGLDTETVAGLTELDADVSYSKYKGTIDKILVLYHGQIAEMSPSLARVSRESNARLKVTATNSGEEYYNGSVDAEYRVEGKSLLPNSLEIKVFTKVKLMAENGDKFVVGAQLKCTVSDLVTGMKTQSGIPLDLGFSGLAYSARVVSSFPRVSTASKVLYHLNRMIKAIYEK
jgi:hypothetical protein